MAGSATAGLSSLESGQQLRVQNIWFLHTNTIISEPFARESVWLVIHTRIFTDRHTLLSEKWAEDYIETVTDL